MKQISAASLPRFYCPVFVVGGGGGGGTFSFALASGVPPTVVRIRRSVNTLGTVPKRTTPAGNEEKKNENDLSVFSTKRVLSFECARTFPEKRERERERRRRRRKKKRGESHPFDFPKREREREKTFSARTCTVAFK